MTLKESTAQDTALAAKASPQVPDQGGENDGKKQHSKAFLVLAVTTPMRVAVVCTTISRTHITGMIHNVM